MDLQCIVLSPDFKKSIAGSLDLSSLQPYFVQSLKYPFRELFTVGVLRDLAAVLPLLLQGDQLLLLLLDQFL